MNTKDAIKQMHAKELRRGDPARAEEIIDRHIDRMKSVRKWTPEKDAKFRQRRGHR